MELSLTDIIDESTPTKRKIMICALDMFCKNGYSETSIREIATAVGITPGTIYGHYSSKEELLNAMLNDYAEYTKALFTRIDIMPILKEKPNGAGISSCMMQSAAILTHDVYYGSLVHLIHQEGNRNPQFGAFILVRLKDTTDYVERIFNTLKDMNVIRADLDPKYWGAIAYGVFHTISTCAIISRTLKTPGFAVMDIAPIMSCLFDAVINANRA